MARHLTFEERGFLYRLLKEGKSKTEIARLMGRDRSTIHRELTRNTGGRGYRPKQAQRLAEARRELCRKPSKLDDPVVKSYVEDKLQSGGPPTRSPGARGATSARNHGTSCRDRPSTIGSTTMHRNGCRFYVMVGAPRKNAAN